METNVDVIGQNISLAFVDWCKQILKTFTKKKIYYKLRNISRKKYKKLGHYYCGFIEPNKGQIAFNLISLHVADRSLPVCEMIVIDWHTRINHSRYGP